MRPLGPWGRRALLAALAVLVVAVDPALAGPTTTADLINELRYKLLVVAIPVTIAAEAALYYAVKRFSNNEEPSPTRENRRLEVTWTLATAAILVFVGVASYGAMAQPALMGEHLEPDQNDVVVDVEAYQWGWAFDYPNHENVSTDTRIVLPVDSQVYFRVTSRDVVHSFSVPEMGLKQDAFPGEEAVVMTRTTEQGTFQGYCAEFCGVSHAKMTFTVDVMSKGEYQNWLGEQSQRPGDDRS